MNNIFQDLIVEGIVVMYLDDILIFTRIVEEYAWTIQRVLEILTEYKLFLHPEKCKFQKIRIGYLGLIILENKVSMDPVKISRVWEWPTLENQTNVQAFLGFTNFYYWFIHNFSVLAWPVAT